MKDIITNRIDSIGTCITLANSPAYQSVWLGQPPEDFETDLATLTTDYGDTAALAAQLAGAITGDADEKDAAETALENATFVLARACSNHFKKTGDLTNRAKVNFFRSAIQKLRDQALIDLATQVRNLATAASADANAVKRGITAARISSLNGTITLFEGLKNQPRSSIVNRSALLRELETRVAGLREALVDLDDLALQFDLTPAGLLFISAWKQARAIVDAGHGPATPVVPPVNP